VDLSPPGPDVPAEDPMRDEFGGPPGPSAADALREAGLPVPPTAQDARQGPSAAP
jgi:hypothetical protein